MHLQPTNPKEICSCLEGAFAKQTLPEPAVIVVLLMIKETCNTFSTLNYGNYGIFHIMGNAVFISLTVYSCAFLIPV